MNTQSKEQLIQSILKLQAETPQNTKTSFVCSTLPNYQQLIKMSEQELKELEKNLQAAMTAKEAAKRANKYDQSFKSDANKDFKII